MNCVWVWVEIKGGNMQSSALSPPPLPALKTWVGESILEHLASWRESQDGIGGETWGELAPAISSWYTDVSQRDLETLRWWSLNLKPGLCFNVCQGSLACCSPLGRRVGQDWVTELKNLLDIKGNCKYLTSVWVGLLSKSHKSQIQIISQVKS